MPTDESRKQTRNLLNITLYSSESISAMLFSIVSLALIARHFGPEIYARYSMAQSISTALVVLATLGLEPFIIRELVKNRNDRQYATSAFFGMLGGWLIYLCLMLAYYAITDNLSRDYLIICSIACSTLLLKVIFVRLDLQAQNRPAPIALGSLLSRLVSVCYLFFGAAHHYSFESMMLYLPLQASTQLAVMLLLHKKFLDLIQFESFNTRRLMMSLKEASPVLASTTLYYFYSQSDIVIISHTLSEKSVGIYSAASRLIPLSSFIGFTIVSAFYREMDRKLTDDREQFFTYVRTLLSIQLGIALVMAIFVSACSPYIVHILYGDQYADSAAILSIVCWAWLFLLPAALYSRLLIMLDLARYELAKMMIVAPVILALNYLAITNIGIIGAAVVYVVSYFAVDFAVYFLFPATRRLGLTGTLAATDVIFRPIRTIRTAASLLKSRQPA